MSRARSAATKAAKTAASKGLTMLSGRVSNDDLRALDSVQRFAQMSRGRVVSKSESLRLALQLAAAVVAENEGRLAELLGTKARATPDEMNAAVAQLRATERAYRGFDVQVQRLGNNVNQLALIANIGDRVDTLAIENVERVLRGILDEMRAWERFDDEQRVALMWNSGVA